MTLDTSQAAFESIRDIVAERTRPLLAWTGAGLSRSAGLPGWGELRDRLVGAVETKATTMDASAEKRLRAAAEFGAAQDDLWLAMQVLSDGLGPASFADEIRRALGPAAAGEVPENYRRLARLPIRGILDLNLDGLAGRALITADDGKVVQHHGEDIAKLRHIITGRSRFVGNVHGWLDDTETWVFTHRDLDGLLKNAAYQELVRVCLSTHTVIFLGITVDDLAVGGHLEHLSRQEVETPTHFWLTDRVDDRTDQWAESAGIRPIRYAAADGHDAIVGEFLDLLAAAKPHEPAPSPPVSLKRAGLATAPPSPADLQGRPPDEIRRVLNALASSLLSSATSGNYDDYDAFLSEYRYAIYQSWYMSTAAGENTVLDYELTREIASGAFGTVYEAVNAHGKQVAVKVLLENVRRNRDALHAFRRGVASMRILSERNIDGMVGYIEASEIPAVVVMDLVHGPDLAEAKASKYLEDWATILRIGVDLARVIRRAHSVPERVLHRDIRPQNVMMEGYWAGQDWRVTVLDFDLSWHRDAGQASVLHTTAAGYLAPEQMHKSRGVSTRSALVDSFGIGMTLLFLCSGRDPDPDEHLHRDWSASVQDAMLSVPVAEWRSIGPRLGRLIVSATQDEQSARWDMSQIAGELAALQVAAEQPGRVSETELMTEEIAARTPAFEHYAWDSRSLAATCELPTGLRYRLEGDLENDRIGLIIEFAATGVEERGGMRKYLAAGSKRAADQLRAAGWSRVAQESAGGSSRVRAFMPSRRLTGGNTSDNLSDVAERLNTALANLKF